MARWSEMRLDIKKKIALVSNTNIPFSVFFLIHINSVDVESYIIYLSSLVSCFRKGTIIQARYSLCKTFRKQKAKWIAQMLSRAEGSPKVKRNAFGTNFTTFVYNIRLVQELQQKVGNAPQSWFCLTYHFLSLDFVLKHCQGCFYGFWRFSDVSQSLMILLILLAMLHTSDTTMYLSHSNQEVLESRAQSKFDVLQSWFKCNSLSINESKYVSIYS